MSNLITDGYRIKTITQKNSGENSDYPLGTDAIYIDMLSGLDLQEQLLFGNGIHTTDVTVTRTDEYILVTEKYKSKNEINCYQKKTLIQRNKLQQDPFVVPFLEGEGDTDIDFIVEKEFETDNPRNDLNFLSIAHETVIGLGDLYTILYRKENIDDTPFWVPIHARKTVFEIDFRTNYITDISELIYEEDSEYMQKLRLNNTEEDTDENLHRLPYIPTPTEDSSSVVGTAVVGNVIVGQH